ncbi:MAG: Gfo/Idh/MocA family protein [Rummeliibacillus sp.]
MNIVVIGLGSMGKRRIKLLNQYIQQKASKNEEWKIVGVDANPKRCNECYNLFNIQTYSSIKEAVNNNLFNAAIISTPPLSHAEIIRICLEANLHIFTELNLVDNGYEENILLAHKKKKVLFLSSTFLYRKETEYIKKRTQEVHFHGMYQYHVGQYLPDWHPWESYKDFFVEKKESNGCRELFAVELPWLIDTFGEVKSFHSIHRKITNLEINYDDGYQVMIEHESGVIGCLLIDIVTPNVGRKFEMWQEHFCILWEGSPDTLLEYNETLKKMIPVVVCASYEHEKDYNHSIVEDAYYDELTNYIEVVKGEREAKYSFEQDKKVLALINEIEK